MMQTYHPSMVDIIIKEAGLVDFRAVRILDAASDPKIASAISGNVVLRTPPNCNGTVGLM